MNAAVLTFTVSGAVLLATPVPPSFDCGAFVVLLFEPELILVMLTLNVQEEFAGKVPPAKFSVVSPADAFHVPVHVDAMPGVDATCKPPVMMSLKFTPVRIVEAFGLVNVKVN